MNEEEEEEKGKLRKNNEIKMKKMRQNEEN